MSTRGDERVGDSGSVVIIAMRMPGLFADTVAEKKSIASRGECVTWVHTGMGRLSCLRFHSTAWLGSAGSTRRCGCPRTGATCWACTTALTGARARAAGSGLCENSDQLLQAAALCSATLCISLQESGQCVQVARLFVRTRVVDLDWRITFLRA